MAELSQKVSKKDTGYHELARALRENTSLTSLDLRRNQIGEDNMSKLIAGLTENYVLLELKIDIPVKKDGWWTSALSGNFSSFPLQSMYEFYISRDDITV